MNKKDMSDVFSVLKDMPATPLFLAPMAGFTDAPFRLLCGGLGADMTVSEMISAKAMVYKDKKTAFLSKIAVGEVPVSLQLFGHEPEVIEEAAAMLASGSFAGCSYARRPSAIDINMGCPVKKIVSSGDGSSLMRDPELCMKITEAAVRGAKPYGVPVTVKMRAGFSGDEINAREVAIACADSGARAVAVHARTRDRMYAPGIDLDVIASVREALSDDVFVIGNGDIRSFVDARNMIEKTGCNAVMIGREALGNPWIFSEIKSCFSGSSFIPPAREERLDTAYRLILAIAREKGESSGVREARGRASHFIKGLSGAAEMRAQLNRAETVEEIRRILCISE